MGKKALFKVHFHVSGITEDDVHKQLRRENKRQRLWLEVGGPALLTEPVIGTDIHAVPVLAY